MSLACRAHAAPTSAASTVVIVPTVLALQVTGASVAFISGYRRGAPEPPRQIRMMVAVGTISSRSSLDHSGCLRDWRRPRHVWPRGQPQSTPHRALADEPRRSAERSMRGGRYLPPPVSPVSKTSATSATDVLAVGFFLQRQARLARSTHRVTSPFPGSLHPKIHHIHRPADLPDVYAGIDFESRPYDAILDVFLALPPVLAELHA